MRIVELEEVMNSGKRWNYLTPGCKHGACETFYSTSPGTSFLDAHNLYGGKKLILLTERIS